MSYNIEEVETDDIMARTSTPRRITDDTLRNIIIKRLPKLLEKEPSLRDYLASILAQKFADKRETEETIKEILQNKGAKQTS